jgi:hypothetical protein
MRLVPWHAHHAGLVAHHHDAVSADIAESFE